MGSMMQDGPAPGGYDPTSPYEGKRRYRPQLARNDALAGGAGAPTISDIVGGVGRNLNGRPAPAPVRPAPAPGYYEQTYPPVPQTSLMQTTGFGEYRPVAREQTYPPVPQTSQMQTTGFGEYRSAEPIGASVSGVAGLLQGLNRSLSGADIPISQLVGQVNRNLGGGLPPTPTPTPTLSTVAGLGKRALAGGAGAPTIADLIRQLRAAQGLV